ncbi:5-hydroxytryptamine receptor 2B-like [Centruroides sculpturatus]|uniref:5-hydroxytryptamine receptor 2B-like n=1 Tax=Centruroides sculpturatus TaxID=218467 RepID=UPI000C6E55F9|nr:5-hydroxytryptamine receptor 2B-like [Centruroides sculpturatus]XP_023223056.1 5-hydroxytryptamine receptor 2B-like [Centruroides sculpturatus]XP_023223059.1 5-hydroxytryptamine receptor 2B-like [Centruroides sculpturatus]
MYFPFIEMNNSWTLPEEQIFLMNLTFLTDTYLWPLNNTHNLTYYINETHDSNSSVENYFTDTNLMFMAFTSVALGVVISATVVGNVFVIAAIFLERNLQTVGNGLVLSLAVADLMVACLVMPLGAVYEVRQEWTLGPELCDVWTSCDVLCCTASILHLLAIAVDRYWAVTHVDYVRQRNIRHISVMIIIVWGVAFVVSVAPVFGWKDPDFHQRVEIEKRCLVSQDAAYQIFATCSTFYVPLVAIFVLYGRIYRVARKRIRNKPGSRSVPVLGKASKTSVSPVMTELTVVTTTTSSSHHSSDFNCATNGMTDHQDITAPILPKKKRKKRKECLELKREKKAAKTLAIITGVFVVCWLPFFVTALLMPLCQLCQPEDYVFSIFLWLGYANSMINPIIYTIFSPDFRNAFTRILCGEKRSTYRR